MTRDVPWHEVRRLLRDRRDSAMTQLMGCPLEEVERIRGRVEAYNAILAIENHTPSETSGAVSFVNS